MCFTVLFASTLPMQWGDSIDCFQSSPSGDDVETFSAVTLYMNGEVGKTVLDDYDEPCPAMCQIVCRHALATLTNEQLFTYFTSMMTQDNHKVGNLPNTCHGIIPLVIRHQQQKWANSLKLFNNVHPKVAGLVAGGGAERGWHPPIYKIWWGHDPRPRDPPHPQFFSSDLNYLVNDPGKY